MGKKKYPLISEITKLRNPQGKCFVCGQPKSDRAITVEIWHMRGDDEVFKAHGTCLGDRKSAAILDMLIERKLVYP